MISSAIVTTPIELHEILQLQQQNLKQHISRAERNSQGFVTMSFTMPVLQAMHQLAPSVIVKDDDKVVAYALVFLKEGRRLYPPLDPLFLNLEKLSWKDRPLDSYDFYVMGQICVSKEYRGKGIVDLLYQKHKEIYSERFDFVLTEISVVNYRSLRAHERIGFQTISIHKDELDEWALVLWDWRS